jgi:ribosome-associated translation inhibitor RaiA
MIDITTITMSIGQKEIEEAIREYMEKKLSKIMNIKSPLKIDIRINNSYSDPRGDSSPGSVAASVTVPMNDNY